MVDVEVINNGNGLGDALSSERRSAALRVEPATQSQAEPAATIAALPLRIWWVPQIPMKAFEMDVPDLATADILLTALGDYDAFQFENNVKPDYCNAGGLMMFEDGEWIDWFDDAMCCEFDQWRSVHGVRARAASVDRSGEASETGTGSTEGESAGPKGIAQGQSS